MGKLSESFKCWIEDNNRLSSLRKKFTTAEDLGLNHCIKCGWCCHFRACIPSPIELKIIASFLKMSIDQAIQTYFNIDMILNTDIYCVKPSGINRLYKLGKLLDFKETYNEGKCIFLDNNNLCKIYEVRPKMAKDQKCWQKKRKTDRVFDYLLREWRKVPIISLEPFKFDWNKYFI